jgi:hypothetical protein
VHVGRDRVPEGREEARAEAIRARTGIFVHGMQGSLNVAHGERFNKGSRKGTAGRVEVGKVKIPRALRSGAKKIFIKIVKDSSFGGVIGEGRAIVVKDGDRVASFPARRLGMEISSVFVTGDSKFHFSAGFPVDPTFLNRGVESLDNERAEAVFQVGERADFLNQVQNVDNNTGVGLPFSCGLIRSSPLA